jgi:L-threonylcarbamoyladenylate synthase
LNRSELLQAVAVLRRGGIVAYPTEACYGLGCDPRNHAAVRRLLALKGRAWSHGLILIADRLERLTPYLDAVPPQCAARAHSTWPGPQTWLWPARPGVSRWLRGVHDTLAVRVTAHRDAAALCRHFRAALVSTSANRHGRAPARSAGEVGRAFGKQVDYVLAGPLGSSPRPTEIRDLLSDEVLRPG